MNKIIVLVFIFCFSNASVAETTWAQILKKDGLIESVDIDSIRREDNVLTAWTKGNKINGKFSLTLHRIDCKTNKSSLNWVVISDDGIFSTSIGTGGFIWNIEEGMTAYEIKKRFC